MNHVSADSGSGIWLLAGFGGVTICVATNYYMTRRQVQRDAEDFLAFREDIPRRSADKSPRRQLRSPDRSAGGVQVAKVKDNDQFIT